jgi:hypothetical protein
VAYTKLFSSIITSTIWIEDDQTRIVWITMLALADKNGEVQGSVPGLARLAGVSVEACDAALAKFLAPDDRSRTKTDEGRRVAEIDGGWLLLNYAKYRRKASLDDKKEQDAIRQKRARQRRGVTHSHAPVTSQTDIAEAEAEADTEAKIEESESAQARPTKGKAHGRGTRLGEDWQPTQALADFARDQGLDPQETRERFRDYWIAQPGQRGCKVDWEATWRNWCRNDTGRGSTTRKGVRSSRDGGDAGAFARAAARLGGREPVR